MKPGSRIRNVFVGTVYVFGILLILGALTSGGDSPDAGPSEPTAEMENTETTTMTDGGQPAAEAEDNGSTESNGASTTTPTQTSETDEGSSGSDGEADIRVRIITDGEWSGSVGTLESSRSVDGEGETTIDINDSADSVSASIQKEAQNDRELTVQILRGDTVLKESSTTAEFGVVSVSAMPDGGTATGDSSDSNDQDIEVRVQYEGDWSGSISAGGQSRSVEGSGAKTIGVEASDAMVVSANAQKDDDSDRELTIQILIDGEVVQESSTTAEYGIASVTAEV